MSSSSQFLSANPQTGVSAQLPASTLPSNLTSTRSSMFPIFHRISVRKSFCVLPFSSYSPATRNGGPLSPILDLHKQWWTSSSQPQTPQGMVHLFLPSPTSNWVIGASSTVLLRIPQFCILRFSLSHSHLGLLLNPEKDISTHTNTHTISKACLLL